MFSIRSSRESAGRWPHRSGRILGALLAVILGVGFVSAIGSATRGVESPRLTARVGARESKAIGAGVVDRGSRWGGWERWDGFSSSEGWWVSPEWDVGVAWNELIVSWNVRSNVWVRVEAQAERPQGGWTRYYSFGEWVLGSDHDRDRRRRTSHVEGNDDDGRVSTDTLTLRTAARRVRVRMKLEGGSLEDSVRGLYLATSSTVGGGTGNSEAVGVAGAGRGATVGGEAPVNWAVPVFSQADYPEGVTKWCSPTSLAMVLGWWGEVLDRPSLRVEPPEAARAVFDPGWDGTGNWIFNVAYAGAQPGVRASVIRLNGLAELEDLLRAGIPVICSVSYDLIRGKPVRSRSDGHLVVVRGLEADGDLWINDPGVQRARGVRRIRRGDFERGWDVSRRTAYVIWSESGGLPAHALGFWRVERR